jgi:hypothetical protein
MGNDTIDAMNMICDIYISQEEEHMSTLSMTTSNSLAKIGATQGSSEATIKDLAEQLAAQTGENQRLIIENRILWDLFFIRRREVNMS